MSEVETDNAPAEAVDNAPAEQVETPKFGDLLQHAPDEYKDAKTWEKFRDVDMPTALKAIVDMDRYTGKKGDIPQEGATPEELAEFAGKLGLSEASFAEGEKIELDDTFGDQRGELEGFYTDYVSGFMEKVAEAFKANPTLGAVKQAAIEYAKQDAMNSKQSGIEAQAAQKEEFNSAAQRLGVTPEELNRVNTEFVAKMGNDQMTQHELIYKFATETSNSQTLKGSLTSTTVGKQTRMQEIYDNPAFWNKTSENATEHARLVEEHTKLFDALQKQA
jgi:hypothetical protein